MKMLSILLFFVFATMSAQASFMYEEIDPICSISGTTHTFFPGEISDTSRWHIPKAYDGECVETPELTQKQKNATYDIIISYLENKNYLSESGNNLNAQGMVFMQDSFFTAVQKYIAIEIEKPNPNMRNIAILNHAVSMIGYDYQITQSNHAGIYSGLTLEAAQELAKSNGTTLRASEIDGQAQMLTKDYRPGRINAIIENGIVVNYSVEGE